MENIDEFKAGLERDLIRYLDNLGNRELPLFDEALKKAGTLSGTNISREIVLRLRGAAAKGIQALRAFSDEINEIEKITKEARQ
ncbi:MAG: hypothetical protein PHI60_08915 [Candidatus Omnitrophica bacterium]|nr:hypothetical protein [Candidatus Omnitrophota bacterium]